MTACSVKFCKDVLSVVSLIQRFSISYRLVLSEILDPCGVALTGALGITAHAADRVIQYK